MALQGFRRLLASLACIVVGGASFALSFVALRDVAVALEAVPAHLGWLVPIVIDGGVICGSAIIWSLSREQDRRPFFPFAFVAALVAVSVVVNASHAGPTPLAKLIAALPPLILLGTLELVASQGRRLAISGSTTPSATAPVDAPRHVASPATIISQSSASGQPQAVISPTINQNVPVVSQPSAAIVADVDPIDVEAVSFLEAAVEEVFEPSAWIDPEKSLPRPTGYTRPVNARRKPTRVRAEQPLN